MFPPPPPSSVYRATAINWSEKGQTKQTHTGRVPKICDPDALGSCRSCHNTAAGWPIINVKKSAGCAVYPSVSITPRPPQPPAASVSHHSSLFMCPRRHQDEVMRLVARALHSMEVMRNRNALNTQSGVQRRGCMQLCVYVVQEEEGRGGPLRRCNRVFTAPLGMIIRGSKCLKTS